MSKSTTPPIHEFDPHATPQDACELTDKQKRVLAEFSENPTPGSSRPRLDSSPYIESLHNALEKSDRALRRAQANNASLKSDLQAYLKKIIQLSEVLQVTSDALAAYQLPPHDSIVRIAREAVAEIQLLTSNPRKSIRS